MNIRFLTPLIIALVLLCAAGQASAVETEVGIEKLACVRTQSAANSNAKHEQHFAHNDQIWARLEFRVKEARGKQAVLRWSLKEENGDELESGKDKFSVHDGHNIKTWRALRECEFYGEKRLYLTVSIEVNLVEDKRTEMLRYKGPNHPRIEALDINLYDSSKRKATRFKPGDEFSWHFKYRLENNTLRLPATITLAYYDSDGGSLGSAEGKGQNAQNGTFTASGTQQLPESMNASAKGVRYSIIATVSLADGEDSRETSFYLYTGDSVDIYQPPTSPGRPSTLVRADDGYTRPGYTRAESKILSLTPLDTSLNEEHYIFKPGDAIVARLNYQAGNSIKNGLRLNVDISGPYGFESNSRLKLTDNGGQHTRDIPVPLGMGSELGRYTVSVTLLDGTNEIESESVSFWLRSSHSGRTDGGVSSGGGTYQPPKRVSDWRFVESKGARYVSAESYGFSLTLDEEWDAVELYRERGSAALDMSLAEDVTARVYLFDYPSKLSLKTLITEFEASTDFSGGELDEAEKRNVRVDRVIGSHKTFVGRIDGEWCEMEVAYAIKGNTGLVIEVTGQGLARRYALEQFEELLTELQFGR